MEDNVNQEMYWSARDGFWRDALFPGSVGTEFGVFVSDPSNAAGVIAEQKKLAVDQATTELRALLKETAEALRHYHLEWMDQAHENPEGAPLLCMHSQMAEDRAMTALAKLRAAGLEEGETHGVQNVRESVDPRGPEDGDQVSPRRR